MEDVMNIFINKLKYYLFKSYRKKVNKFREEISNKCLEEVKNVVNKISYIEPIADFRKDEWN
jgi:hypothetical protein